MMHWTLYRRRGSKRCYHAAVAVDHRLYTFGEYDKTHRDRVGVHVFNTVSLRWERLHPGASMTTTRGGEQRLHPEEAAPSMSWGQTAVLIGAVIYVFGGYWKGRYLDALHGFDVDAHGWFRPETSGAAPGARSNHSAFALEAAMYVFGGLGAGVVYFANDICKLNTDTMVWSRIDTGGAPPAPISLFHSCTVIGTRMFMFGGRGVQFDYYNGVSVFDTETDRWLSAPSVRQLLPERRECHSAFAHNGELYVFGGYRNGRTFNDLWRFNPDAVSWRRLEPRGRGPCPMFSACCSVVGDRDKDRTKVLFGGGYVSMHSSAQVSDLYVLDLSPSLKTLSKLAVVRHGLKRSGLPHDVRWELAAMTNDGGGGGGRTDARWLASGMFRWVLAFLKALRSMMTPSCLSSATQT